MDFSRIHFAPYTYYVIQRYLALFGCILISLTVGSVYTFGNLLPHLSSYLAYKNNNGTGDGNLRSVYKQYHYQTNTVYCLYMIFRSVSMAFGGKIPLIFGCQRSCLMGCFILSFGVGLTYFTCKNLFLLCLTYCIMNGVGCGIVYPSIIIAAMSWFPNRKKFVAAIISCSYGFGRRHAGTYVVNHTVYIGKGTSAPKKIEYLNINENKWMNYAVIYNLSNIF